MQNEFHVRTAGVVSGSSEGGQSRGKSISEVNTGKEGARQWLPEAQEASSTPTPHLIGSVFLTATIRECFPPERGSVSPHSRTGFHVTSGQSHRLES